MGRDQRERNEAFLLVGQTTCGDCSCRCWRMDWTAADCNNMEVANVDVVVVDDDIATIGIEEENAAMLFLLCVVAVVVGPEVVEVA